MSTNRTTIPSFSNPSVVVKTEYVLTGRELKNTLEYGEDTLSVLGFKYVLSYSGGLISFTRNTTGPFAFVKLAFTKGFR